MKLGRKHTSKQRGYYFGVCVEMVREALLSVPWAQGLREMLLDKRSGKDFTHEIIKNATGFCDSIKTLMTDRFNEYIIAVQEWAARVLDIYIPDPNELMAGAATRKDAEPDLHNQSWHKTPATH